MTSQTEITNFLIARNNLRTSQIHLSYRRHIVHRVEFILLIINRQELSVLFWEAARGRTKKKNRPPDKFNSNLFPAIYFYSKEHKVVKFPTSNYITVVMCLFEGITHILVLVLLTCLPFYSLAYEILNVILDNLLYYLGLFWFLWDRKINNIQGRIWYDNCMMMLCRATFVALTFRHYFIFMCLWEMYFSYLSYSLFCWGRWGWENLFCDE